MGVALFALVVYLSMNVPETFREDPKAVDPTISPPVPTPLPVTTAPSPAKTAEMYKRNASLSRVEVRPSPLSSTRRIVDVIFTYTHRETDVDEKYFVRVDVTEEFPFLAAPLQPFYER